ALKLPPNSRAARAIAHGRRQVQTDPPLGLPSSLGRTSLSKSPSVSLQILSHISAVTVPFDIIHNAGSTRPRSRIVVVEVVYIAVHRVRDLILCSLARTIQPPQHND